MTQKLMDRGCPREVAAELSLLVLWDLVVLIGTHCLRIFFLCHVLIAIHHSLIDSRPCSKVVVLTNEI